MKERPILFSALMVRAILEGRKTQTRRVIKPQPCIDEMNNFCWNGLNFGQGTGLQPHVQALASPIPSIRTKRVHCPYGAAGDRLWVRETFAQWHGQELFSGRPWPLTAYRAGRSWINGNCPGYAQGETFWEAPDDKPEDVKWRPPIFMPRSASRILLEVTDVRVQRVQDIGEEDAIAEGIPDPAAVEESPAADDARNDFRDLWDSINAKRGFGWKANPWVWAITFRRIETSA